MNNEIHTHVSGKVSSGVEDLIQKLRKDGIEAGKSEAARIVDQAKEEAAQIVNEARSKAEQIVSEADKEADRLKKGGEDSLHIAMRDILLELKAKLTETVSDRVKQLISAELAQEDFLKDLILEVAGRARRDSGMDEAEKISILLPKDLVGLEELRLHPLELRKGGLSHFILNVASDLLREGVTFGETEDGRQGMRIYLEEKDIQIDLTDEGIAQILLEHLQPRFRAILEGMVK